MKQSRRKRSRIIIVEDKSRNEVFINEGIVAITRRMREDDLFLASHIVNEIRREDLHKSLQLPSDIEVIGSHKDLYTDEIIVRIEGKCLPNVRLGDVIPRYYPVFVNNQILWPFKRYKEI